MAEVSKIKEGLNFIDKMSPGFLKQLHFSWGTIFFLFQLFDWQLPVPGFIKKIHLRPHFKGCRKLISKGTDFLRCLQPFHYWLKSCCIIILNNSFETNSAKKNCMVFALDDQHYLNSYFLRQTVFWTRGQINPIFFPLYSKRIRHN